MGTDSSICKLRVMFVVQSFLVFDSHFVIGTFFILILLNALNLV